jgi:hypothetical protein
MTPKAEYLGGRIDTLVSIKIKTFALLKTLGRR